MTLLGESWKLFPKTGFLRGFFSEILLTHAQKFDNKSSDESENGVGDNDMLVTV